MNKICIICPRGCLLNIQTYSDNKINVSGNHCHKGLEYGRQEALCPMRTLTTTVRTDSVSLPRIPVRLSKEIPLDSFKTYMKLVSKIILESSCIPGEIIASNIGGSGIDIIATRKFIHEA